MKSSITLLITAAGVTVAALGAPSQPPEPGPEIQRLQVWFGEWTYEKELLATPLWPAARYSGSWTGRPALDGFSTLFHFKEQRLWGEKQWLELNWFDAQSGSIAYVNLDNTGGAEQGRFTFDGNVCSWVGTFLANGKLWHSRGTETVAADGLSSVWKGEISADGTTWIPALTKTCKKVASAPADTAAVEQELIKLEGDWNAALLTNDVAFVSRILADDFTSTDDEGVVSSKSQSLAGLTSGDFKCTASVLEDREVHVFGDTAVFTSRSTQTAQWKGKDMSGQFRWTDTWIRRDGRWQCVASHSSRVAQK